MFIKKRKTSNMATNGFWHEAYEIAKSLLEWALGPATMP